MQPLASVRVREVDQPTYVIAHRADDGGIGEQQRPPRAVGLETALDHRERRTPHPQAVHQNRERRSRIHSSSIYNAPPVDLFWRHTGEEEMPCCHGAPFLNADPSHWPP